MTVPLDGAASDTMEATVTTMHGPLVRVWADGDELVVPARHRLTWEGEPVEGRRLVVGDRVIVEVHRREPVITGVLRRRTVLLRRDERSAQPKIVAANVDQAAVVFAAARPQPNRRLLDRFLVAAHHAGLGAIVVINKSDLGTDAVEAWLATYIELGYPVLATSAKCGSGIEDLRARLVGRTSLFCGPSGTGKSSILNAIQPGLSLKVGDVSRATGKGRHTTTAARLLPLDGGGFVVDTPGIKAFGLWDLRQQELLASFPEIARAAEGCRFTDCGHSDEPGCAVLVAVGDGSVDPERLRSYLTLRAEVADTA